MFHVWLQEGIQFSCSTWCNTLDTLNKQLTEFTIRSTPNSDDMLVCLSGSQPKIPTMIARNPVFHEGISSVFYGFPWRLRYGQILLDIQKRYPRKARVAIFSSFVSSVQSAPCCRSHRFRDVPPASNRPSGSNISTSAAQETSTESASASRNSGRIGRKWPLSKSEIWGLKSTRSTWMAMDLDFCWAIWWLSASPRSLADLPHPRWASATLVGRKRSYKMPGDASKLVGSS